MSFRAWVYAAALGLTVFASSGQAQQETQSEQGQPDTGQEPAQTLPVPLLVEIVGDEAEAEASQRREEEASQREIDDLVAQQGMNAATQAMNDATQKMAFHSLLSTIFVGVGTVLLVATLLLTWQANRAAVKAVEITEEVGKKQIRAYVHTDHVTTSVFPAGPSINVRIGVKNFGQSPARGLNLSYMWIVERVPFSSDWWNDIPEPSSQGDLPPGATAFVQLKAERSVDASKSFGKADYRDVVGGAASFWVIAKISYKDIFGNERETFERFRYDPGANEMVVEVTEAQNT